jgi:hypothetical protein
MKKTFYFLTIAGIFIFFLAGNHSYGQSCGPGAHWIDSCPGGTDSFQSTATVNVDANLDCIGENFLGLTGPTTVLRQPADAIDPGEANCPAPAGHTGNFHIQTEIINATMTAAAPGGGQFIMKIGHSSNPELQPSIGHIVEMEDSTLGCSYFDVYFKLYVPEGAFGSNPAMWLYNHIPCRLYATITQAPPLPGTVYAFPQCIELYTSPVGGVLIVKITDPHHYVINVIPTLSQWGLIIFAVLLATAGVIFILRRKRVFLLHVNKKPNFH